MSASTVHRPTEDKAIGAWRPRELSIGLLLVDQATARRRLDRYAEHLLGGLIQRAIGKVGA